MHSINIVERFPQQIERQKCDDDEDRNQKNHPQPTLINCDVSSSFLKNSTKSSTNTMTAPPLTILKNQNLFHSHSNHHHNRSQSPINHYRCHHHPITHTLPSHHSHNQVPATPVAAASIPAANQSSSLGSPLPHRYHRFRDLLIGGPDLFNTYIDDGER